MDRHIEVLKQRVQPLTIGRYHLRLGERVGDEGENGQEEGRDESHDGGSPRRECLVAASELQGDQKHHQPDGQRRPAGFMGLAHELDEGGNDPVRRDRKAVARGDFGQRYGAGRGGHASQLARVMQRPGSL